MAIRQKVNLKDLNGNNILVPAVDISELVGVSVSTLSNGDALLYNSTTSKWENKPVITETIWGSITGDIENQTDLNNALSTKSDIGHTHSKSEITDFPTNVSDFTNDAGYLVLSDIANKADKATTLLGYGITDAYTKTEVDTKLTATYRFKGSVNDYTELPTSGQEVGDVYNLINAGGGYLAGDNVAWDGTNWDKLGGVVDLSNYYTKSQTYSQTEVDNLFGSLATVATTGSYTDLIDKPTIPIISNTYDPLEDKDGMSGVAVASAISTKANSTDVYTKSEVYTKAEIDALLANFIRV